LNDRRSEHPICRAGWTEADTLEAICEYAEAIDRIARRIEDAIAPTAMPSPGKPPTPPQPNRQEVRKSGAAQMAITAATGRRGAVETTGSPLPRLPPRKGSRPSTAGRVDQSAPSLVPPHLVWGNAPISSWLLVWTTCEAEARWSAPQSAAPNESGSRGRDQPLAGPAIRRTPASGAADKAARPAKRKPRLTSWSRLVLSTTSGSAGRHVEDQDQKAAADHADPAGLFASRLAEDLPGCSPHG
jgi:hypothetical protein